MLFQLPCPDPSRKSRRRERGRFSTSYPQTFTPAAFLAWIARNALDAVEVKVEVVDSLPDEDPGDQAGGRDTAGDAPQSGLARPPAP